ncbi:hypothetical protein [Hymenobacter cellulosilyticus]|uniref:Uncharacterized protein n=1 Tax=Hymenobacter cellulosilyticus TaxID=2932248 RepID=A0A8T9Q8P1_9BACT|nr:hypothetical protein [Hymenobacter cellulosilyticus]UOQ72170.1 hypothetical protein MUN79_27010 [Hymenobacter cellulosilyticus]
MWPNAYKNTSTAFAKQQLRNGSRKFEFAKDSQRGYIDQLDFKVNGQSAQLAYDPENPDIAKLILPQPLAPAPRPPSRRLSTSRFRTRFPASATSSSLIR